jgi:hypothetical protein
MEVPVRSWANAMANTPVTTMALAAITADGNLTLWYRFGSTGPSHSARCAAPDGRCLNVLGKQRYIRLWIRRSDRLVSQLIGNRSHSYFAVGPPPKQGWRAERVHAFRQAGQSGVSLHNF